MFSVLSVSFSYLYSEANYDRNFLDFDTNGNYIFVLSFTKLLINCTIAVIKWNEISTINIKYCET